MLSRSTRWGLMLVSGRTKLSGEETNSLQTQAAEHSWSKIHRLAVSAFGIGLLLWSGHLAYGQNGRASINGTVTDPSGAVIAGAHISAKNLETAQITTVTTGSEGNYSMPFLPIGHYEITAS